MLSTDVEKNPGPVPLINPIQTIYAPYSQGNEAIFGGNAGQQCVAMSLCALIYNHKSNINSSSDLIQIMNTGNQLYSCLSKLLNQTFLMLTELPAIVEIADTNYQLQYSESYCGLLHVIHHDENSTIEDFPYCVRLCDAMESLMRDNYVSFVLTIGCITVGIYCISDGHFKIFDSHSRDRYGMTHSLGTCVVLEVQSVHELVEYFERVHQHAGDVTFEIKGVSISVTENEPEQTDLADRQEENHSNSFVCKKSSVTSFYAICFSVIKACSYWNSETLRGIVDHGKLLYEKLTVERHRNLPNKVVIYEADVDVTFDLKSYGTLSCMSVHNRQCLQSLIEDHLKGSTGFLLSVPSKCISCVVQHLAKRKKTYFIYAASENEQYNIFEKVSGIVPLVRTICDIVVKQDFPEVQFEIQFLSCSSKLLSAERKYIVRKHKSSNTARNNCSQLREEHSSMEPHKKKRRLHDMYIYNKSISSKRKTKYGTMDTETKKQLLRSAKEKYKMMELQQKQDLLSHCATKYRSLDPEKKSKVLQCNIEKYNSMEPGSKLLYLKKVNDKYHNLTPEKRLTDITKKRNVLSKARRLKNCLPKDLDDCLAVFKGKIKEGPYYACSVCHRMLYKRSVVKLNKDKYDIQDLFTNVKSFDEREHICKTCKKKILTGNVPCQAVRNNMHIDDIPPELAALEKLEQILIAQRIVFQKIVVMPKGQQRKIKGAICNIPVDCDKSCRSLPRPPETSGIILLKLKRKLHFRGHVYFQAVRPQYILNALNWLKKNNPLYGSIAINIDNIDQQLTSLQQFGEQNSETNHLTEDDNSNINMLSSQSSTDSVMVNGLDPAAISDGNEEERDDPLNEYRAPTNETCLQSLIPDYPILVEQENENNVSIGNEIYNIAPGENKHPVSLMTDKLCEELAFPVLFPKGRFGYTLEREVKLTPVKYFNARLLHRSGRFATNPEYLFYAQFIIEQKKVSDSINIAMKKMCGHSITASQLRSNPQSLQNLISQDQAYLFLRQIPGSPPYWQKFMYEVVAMVKQLGIPTWFLTLSCADLRWPELFQIIARCQGMNMTDEQVEELSYIERCSMLNLNPVIVAKHFQYRVETFFREVLLSNANPIGKIIYYALRIEFQMRGSPHLHALIWTSDCPKLTNETKQSYVQFIDNHVQAYVPNKDTHPQLHELVSTYQKHNHSKTCRKYKNVACRFHFGQFFTDRTVVSQPLSDDLDDEIKANTLSIRNEILTSVKQKIDDVLNPSKSDYEPALTSSEIFKSLGISQEQYYWALGISSDSDYELHLKRPLDSCFINNYFVAGMQGFRANVDLQPVFNHYKCVTYICAYLSKDETECSQAIMNAAKEAKTSNLNIRDGLKKIGAAFLSTREVSSQECVYRCMPELWLRKIFPKTVFVNTGLPDKRIRVAKTQEQLDELDDESTDIFKSNIIERYMKRPRFISAVNNLCLAKFAAFYYKDYKKDNHETSDAQPDVLTDNIVESQHTVTNCDELLPKKIRLMDTNEVMKRRKIMAVIRFHTPNKTKESENYFHHLLMLYLPWREESQLIGNEHTYISKFNEPKVQAIIKQNREIFEPDEEALTEALESLRNNPLETISYDSLNDQENADIRVNANEGDSSEESFNEQSSAHFSKTTDSRQQQNPGISVHQQPSDISDDLLRESVRSLNKKQRLAYDTVLSWCRTKMSNLNSLKPQKVDPMHLFITGGAGSGKSHLIKTIYHTATKTFRQAPMNPEFPTVLLMAPTGVAAININGTTINTALAIPKETGDNVPAMSDQKKTQFRLSLSQLKIIIIDEISMVANTTLLHIHQRLKDIFATPNSQLFANISVIVVGDLYQLPPIRRKPVFENYKNDVFNLYHPWQAFTMIELTEIMRQKEDLLFAELLNRFRTASQTVDDIERIQSRSVTPSDHNYPSEALHIWAENKPVMDYNNRKLEQLSTPLFVLKAVDQCPPNVSKQDIDRVLLRGRSETGGLDQEITMKEGARVMLTTNIDIADRLINGQMGTVIRIAVNENNNRPTTIFVKFDDEKAGNISINKATNSFTRQNRLVPIVPLLVRIKVRPGKPSSPEIQRIQFPISLAWACTVHKVQGLTVSNIVISFDLHRQRSFNYGQIYVAISRATTLEGLHILGEIKDKHVKADTRVHEEYHRLRQMMTLVNKPAHVLDDASAKTSTVTICLLNIRSLKKHSIDIKFDATIFNSDILALTETQLLLHYSDDEIKNDLHPFTLYRQDHSDRYASLAICIRNSIQTLNHEDFPSLNATMFEVIHVPTLKKKTFLLLYRKNNSDIKQYVDGIRYLICSNSIDIILGDFNVNYLNETDVRLLKSMMESLQFTQIVQNPTFISAGSTLDHIYLKLDSLQVHENRIVSVYYSDHECVKISLKFL
jgi:DNA replication protein DnaC